MNPRDAKVRVPIKGWFSAVLVVALIMAGDGKARAQERMTIAVGQRGSWDTSISELGQRGGIFRKHGLELEILYTDGGGETLQAVISRSVDVGVGVGVMGLLGAYARNAPIRVVGAEMTGASDLFWYVRANSPIRSVADAAGKTIAFSTNGSSTNSVVRALLEQHGVRARPQATGTAPATLTMVMSNQIDIGWANVPFALDQLDRGQIRLLARGSDASALRGQTVRVLGAHAQTIDRRADAINRYLRAYRETIDWMYANPEALRIYAGFAGISDALARRTRDEFFPKAALNPDQVVGLNMVMQEAVGLDFLQRPLTPQQVTQLIRIPARN
jgi:NitT/TauT family transport system substrate-binding protein